jgi:putative intracellular protease/amidase
MARTIGILVFDDAEELDFVGPWEVFASTTQHLFPDDRVVLIAEEQRPIRCQGLRTADFDFVGADLDVAGAGHQETRRGSLNGT